MTTEIESDDSDLDRFRAEARRQSLLASAAEDSEEAEFWERLMDTRGWR